MNDRNLRRVAYVTGAAWLLIGPLVSYGLTHSTQIAWLTLIASVAFLCLIRVEDLTELTLDHLGRSCAE
jgi:hypothetical protein